MTIEEKIKILLKESGLFWDREIQDDSLCLEFYKQFIASIDIFPGLITIILIQDGVTNFFELTEKDICEIPRILITNYKLLDEFNKLKNNDNT